MVGCCVSKNKDKVGCVCLFVMYYLMMFFQVLQRQQQQQPIAVLTQQQYLAAQQQQLGMSELVHSFPRLWALPSFLDWEA